LRSEHIPENTRASFRTSSSSPTIAKVGEVLLKIV